MCHNIWEYRLQSNTVQAADESGVQAADELNAGNFSSAQVEVVNWQKLRLYT